MNKDGFLYEFDCTNKDSEDEICPINEVRLLNYMKDRKLIPVKELEVYFKSSTSYLKVDGYWISSSHGNPPYDYYYCIETHKELTKYINESIELTNRMKSIVKEDYLLERLRRVEYFTWSGMKY